MLAQQLLAQPRKGGLHHPLHAQVRQHLGDVIQKQRVGSQNHQLLGPEGFPVRVKQPGDAVQRVGGFAAARYALNDQRLAGGMPDDQVLLCLNGGNNLPQLVRGNLPQHALQVGILAHHAAVEQPQQIAVPHGKHALERQLPRHGAVRRRIGHGAGLPGVVQVGHRGPPVHHHRVEIGRGHNPPTPQIMGFRLSARGGEVKPCKIRLVSRQPQLMQGIQLHAEDVQGDDFVHGGILGHGDHAVFFRPYAGFFLQLAKFPVDDVAGLLQMRVLCLALGMIG